MSTPPDKEATADPVGVIFRLVAGAEPMMDLAVIRFEITRVAGGRAKRRRLAQALLDAPALLTTGGPPVPWAAGQLLLGLRSAGAQVIAAPRCGECGRADGGPLCPNCLVNDPANLEDCTRCGSRRRVAVRTAGGPLCQGCRPRPVLACSICGREKPCEISRATGQPWCENCQNRWRRCSACGTMAPLHGGAPGKPLCARCVNPDPGFWDRCPECRETWVISPRPCQRCVLGRHVRQLLGNEAGQVRPDLAPLLTAGPAQQHRLLLPGLDR